jgi:hypothetical protein
MGFNDKFAIVVRFGRLLPLRASPNTVGIAGIEVRGLADPSPSERQRSDFMSFQTSIIFFVLQPCR